MSIEPSTQHQFLDISEHQRGFAESLGVDFQTCTNDAEFILLIERQLGQKSMLELARWFLLSVLQHIQNQDWGDISHCPLDEQQQYQLAHEFIGRDEFKQSLLTVLKHPRFRFTLVSFAKSRNQQRRVLSTTTKAFRQAREILLRHELVDQQLVSRKGRRPAKQKPTSAATAASRRAARRGIELSSAAAVEPQVSVKSEVRQAQQDAMSEEEFAELDAVLANADAEPGKAWTYQNNDERLSLMFGVLAGGGVFALALWLFL